MAHARTLVALAVLAIGAVAAVVYARSGGSVYVESDPTYGDAIEAATDDLSTEVSDMQDTQAMPTFSADANVRAFLDLVKRCEGTAGAADPYRVCYAYRHTIQSLSDHPAVTGEWRGETLSNAMCAASGFGPGCVSTAAGAYQFIKPTWQTLKAQIRASDFGPGSQDAAAIQLLKNIGAYDRIRAGDLSGAVARASGQWASLPGSKAGQGGKSMSQVVAMFAAAGGAVA